MKCQWTAVWSRPALHMFEWLGEMELKVHLETTEIPYSWWHRQLLIASKRQLSRHHPLWSAPLPSNWLIQQLSFHWGFIPKVSLLCLSRHVSLPLDVAGQPAGAGMDTGPWRAQSASSFLPAFHAHPPSPSPAHSLPKGSENQRLLFHPVLYSTSQCCWMRQNRGLQVTIILHTVHC